MSSIIRRRIRHDDDDDGRRASLAEPLLRDHEDDQSFPPSRHFSLANGQAAGPSGRSSTSSLGNSRASAGVRGGAGEREKDRKGERKAWRDIFLDIVAQWSIWFTHVLQGAGAMVLSLGGTVTGLLPRIRMPLPEIPPLVLSVEQKANLKKLHERLLIPFDGTKEDHQQALRALWQTAFPGEKLQGMVSQQWKEMGWQGTDPSTDFRGGGFISLENLLHFAYRYPKEFRKLLRKEEGKRAEWEYPFAVGGLNITFMLIQLLDLRAEIPNSISGRRFLKLLGEDEKAFDELYCLAFVMMDSQWLAMGASYMEFNVVLQATRVQVEQQLVQNPGARRVCELPAYKQFLPAAPN